MIIYQLIVLLILLTGEIGNAQKINGKKSDSRDGNKEMVVQKTQIEILSLCPQPLLIWPDTNKLKDARIYRSMGGDVLCIPTIQYKTFSNMLRESIYSTDIQPRKQILMNTVIIKTADKAVPHDEIFKLTNSELDAIFKDVLKKMSKNPSIITQNSKEQIKLTFNNIYNCNNH